MKKIALLMMVAFFALLAARAQGANVKIGYVDVQRVLADSKRGQEAKKEIETRGAELNQEFLKRQQEVKALKEELERKGTLLSEEARKEKEREYQKKVKELERFVKDSREELRQMEREVTTQILKEVEKIINELGKEKGYTLILEKQRSFILYAPEEIDLTDEVIKALDSKSQQ
ncbi:MAG TPA: OmpH family outer membrane protein [Deltaproteobacteria bacterium]|nr:OmpH family outer membrane protein [Deltaproteobacteria bacterium]